MRKYRNFLILSAFSRVNFTAALFPEYGLTQWGDFYFEEGVI